MNWWWVDIAIAFAFGGVIGACVVARDAALHLTELSRARKALEKAVEFAGYMATAAEGYMDEANAALDVGGYKDPDSLIDTYRGLRSAIYEFRKRVPARTGKCEVTGHPVISCGCRLCLGPPCHDSVHHHCAERPKCINECRKMVRDDRRRARTDG